MNQLIGIIDSNGLIKKCDIVVNSTGAAETLYVTRTDAHHIYTPLILINNRIGAVDCMVADITLKLAMIYHGKKLFDMVQFLIQQRSSPRDYSYVEKRTLKIVLRNC